MLTGIYDVIGARCAGSPTAMLLARKGYRVLLLDKATFPSFVSVQAATLPASEFFELGNVGRIMGEAGTAG